MKFNEFISLLLEQAKLWSIDPSGVQVLFEPGRKHSAEGEVLLGVGNTSKGEIHHGIVLNNVPPRRLPSLSALVMATDQSEVARWQDHLQGPPALNRLSCTFVVEDLSPDSCFAAILWLARLYGVPPEEIPPRWVKHVTDWESGDVHSIGTPEQSWACLHSVLGHSFIDLQAAGRRDGAELKVISEQVRHGFCTCLEYDLSLLTKPDIQPDAVPKELNLELHWRALLLLKREKQAYRKALAQGMHLQLHLPLGQPSSPANPKTLVDVFLTTELELAALLKVFLRNDMENSWLEQGFSMMAVYRPNAVGTGNDIVISVDPSSGTHLRSLWHKLERLEDHHWGEARRRDHPRRLASYPEGDGPNQPWWDDAGKYTLLAAPKAIDGVEQRKVSWDEVCESIWQLYSPAHDLFLRSADGGASDLPHRLPQHLPDVNPSKKRLLCISWPDEDHSGFLLSPTMQRYLAACSMDDYSDNGVPLTALPEQGSFELLQVPGGFALVHAHGTTLIEDWSNEVLDTERYRTEFDSATKCCNLLQETQQKLKSINPQADREALSQSVKDLSDIKVKLGKGIFDTMPQVNGSGAARFRQALESHWGIANRLETLHQAVASLDSIIQQMIEERSGKMINNISLYGFPLMFFATFFGQAMLTLDPATGALSLHWLPITLCTLCTAATIAGLKYWLDRK